MLKSHIEYNDAIVHLENIYIRLELHEFICTNHFCTNSLLEIDKNIFSQ